MARAAWEVIAGLLDAGQGVTRYRLGGSLQFAQTLIALPFE
jgi:hypothetical protein